MSGVMTARLRVAGFNIKLKAGSDTSVTIPVAHLPANAYFVAAYGRVKTAVAGITAPFVSLGTASDTDLYMTAQPIDVVHNFMMGSTSAVAGSLLGLKGYCAGMDKPVTSSSSTPIIATFTTSSSSFSGLTAGEVEFVVIYVDCNAYLNEDIRT